MQLTERDELVLRWLGEVRFAELPELQWVLGRFGGNAEPLSLRKTQKYVARCREGGYLESARARQSSASIVWASSAFTGRAAPSLLRQTVRHDLTVAAVSARYLWAGWHWLSDERENKTDHSADGVAVRGDHRELVEVELTPKTLSRYPKILRDHEQRMKFEGVTSVVYFTDAAAGRAVSRQVEKLVFPGDRPNYPILPVLDMWGRIVDPDWPSQSPRFMPITSLVAEVDSSIRPQLSEWQ